MAWVVSVECFDHAIAHDDIRLRLAAPIAWGSAFTPR